MKISLLKWHPFCSSFNVLHGGVSLREHLFACVECTDRYIEICRARLFASGCVRAHAIGISRMSRPKTCRHTRDKMAVVAVAVSLVTIPDRLATILVVNI